MKMAVRFATPRLLCRLLPSLAVAATGLLPLAAAAQPVDPYAGRALVLGAHELRGLPGEVAALLMRAEPGGDLTFEINAVALAGAERAQVPVFVEIDGANLLDRGQGVLGRVEVYVYALDAAGKIGDFLVQAFLLDAEKIGEVLWQSGPRFQGNLQLAPGQYRLRVLVRESQSKAAGLRELKLEVPAALIVGAPDAAPAAASAGEPAASTSLGPASLGPVSLGPALFEEPQERDSWIPVRAAAKPAQGLLEESVAELQSRWDRGSVAYPLELGGRAIVPAALPVLAIGVPQRLFLPSRLLVSPTTAAKAEFFAGDKLLASVDLKPPEADDASAAGGNSTLQAFHLVPPTLPAGRYSLQVRQGDRSSAPRDVLLVVHEARNGELLWSDLRWRLPEAIPAAQSRTAEGAGPGKAPQNDSRTEELRVRVGDVADRYRELVRTLPGQPRTVNVARLLELEARILESDASEAMTILQNAEMRVAAELGGWDAESLVPLIHLHYESYLAYRQRRIFPLLTHSRILIDRLVGAYVDRGKSEGVRRLAALFLGGLGLEAEEGNLAASSRRLYHRALELDPDARHALLGLATAEERQNHREEALQLFGRLAKNHPDFSEALLRLGVNEKVARRDPRASFAKAQNLPGPSWVRRLAFEELARLDLDQVEQAAELLAAMPAAGGELSSVALQAHLEDRRGRHARSLELARSAPLTTSESARRRYDEVPREERQNALDALTAAAEIRLPLLVEWAASQGGKK